MSENKKQRAVQLIKDHAQPHDRTPDHPLPTIQISGSHVHISSRDNSYHFHTTNTFNGKSSADMDTENSGHLAEIARLKEAVFWLENTAATAKKKPSAEAKTAGILRPILRFIKKWVY